jgi:glycine betaine transporter
VGVIVAPSLVSMVWFAIFGGLGISLVDKIGIDKVAEAVVNPATALFVAYNQYGLSTVLSIITLCLLITFFVTSANSSTFVLGMFTSNGDLNPSKGNMALWGVVQAMLAAALLLSGGLVALQTASIAAAFPFIFIMLFACISIIKALLKEKV